MDHKIRAELAAKINRGFNFDELRNLLFDLNIDYEEINGRTKYLKIVEFILYVDQRGLVPNLIYTLKQLRPEISWPEPLV